MDNIEGGFIKLYRKMLYWEWYTDINTKVVFIHCLLMANWEDKPWKGQDIERGKFVSSLDKIAQATGLTVSKVRTALKHLEMTHEIAKEGTPKNTEITVLNYDFYQAVSKQDNTQIASEMTSEMTSKSQADAQTDSNQIATTKNYKKYKKERREPKPPHRGWIRADSRSAEYLYAHPSIEGWRIETVDGIEWGYQIKQ